MEKTTIESSLKFGSEPEFHDTNLSSIIRIYNYVCILKENLKEHNRFYSIYDEKYIYDINEFNSGNFNKKYLLNFGEFINEILEENNLNEINYAVLKNLLIDGVLSDVNFDDVIYAKKFNPDVDFLNTLFKFRTNVTITKVFFEHLYKNSDEIFKISLDSILNISENVLQAVNGNTRISKCDRIVVIDLNKLIKNNVLLKSIYPHKNFRKEISYHNNALLIDIFDKLLEISVKSDNIIDFNIESNSNFNESILSKFLYIHDNNLKAFINKNNAFGNHYIPFNAYSFNEIIKSDLYDINKETVDVFKHLISVSLFKKILDKSNETDMFINLKDVTDFINDENVFDKDFLNYLNSFSKKYNSTSKKIIHDLFYYFESRIDIDNKENYLIDDYKLMFYLNNTEDKFLVSDDIIKKINFNLIENNSNNVINILLENKNFNFLENIKRIKNFIKMEYFYNEDNIKDFKNFNQEEEFNINNDVNNILIKNFKNKKLFNLIFGNESAKKIFNLSNEYMQEISQIIDVNSLYQIDMVSNYINNKNKFLIKEILNSNVSNGELFNNKQVFNLISKSTLLNKENVISLFDNLINKINFIDIDEKNDFIDNYFYNIYCNILKNKILLNTKEFVDILINLKDDFKLIDDNTLINILLKLNTFNDKELIEECLNKKIFSFKDKIKIKSFDNDGNIYKEEKSLEKIALDKVYNIDVFKIILNKIGISTITKPDFVNIIVKNVQYGIEIDKEMIDYLIQKKVDLNKVFKFTLDRWNKHGVDKWGSNYETYENLTSLILFNALENKNFKLFKYVLEIQKFEFEELMNKNKKNRYLSMCIEKMVDIIKEDNENSEELIKILMGNKHLILFKRVSSIHKEFHNKTTLSDYFKDNICINNKTLDVYQNCLIENFHILEEKCNIFKLENIDNNALICLTNDKFMTNEETITQDKDLLKVVLNSSNYNLIKEMKETYFLSSISKIKVFVENIEYFPFTIDSFIKYYPLYLENLPKDANKLKILGTLFIHENDMMLLNKEKEKICKLLKIDVDNYQEILIHSVKDIVNDLILKPDFNNKIENEFKLNSDDILKKIKAYEDLICPKTITTKKIRL